MRGKEVLVSAIIFGALGGYAWSSLPAGSVDSADPRTRIEQRVAYYPNCDAARAANMAPIMFGQPGYRPNSIRTATALPANHTT